MTPEELFAEWCAGWVTKDPAEQARRLEACCAEDVEFVPPSADRETVRGRGALVAHVAAYTAAWPAGVGADLARPLETHHGWSQGLVRWTFPDAVAVGCDVMRVEDGRIATMIVFAEPAAATTVPGGAPRPGAAGRPA